MSIGRVVGVSGQRSCPPSSVASRIEQRDSGPQANPPSRGAVRDSHSTDASFRSRTGLPRMFVSAGIHPGDHEAQTHVTAPSRGCGFHLPLSGLLLGRRGCLCRLTRSMSTLLCLSTRDCCRDETVTACTLPTIIQLLPLDLASWRSWSTPIMQYYFEGSVSSFN